MSETVQLKIVTQRNLKKITILIFLVNYFFFGIAHKSTFGVYIHSNIEHIFSIFQ